MDDIMTSSKIYGNNGEAFNEMKRISNALTNLGDNVVREKIVASYWHTKAPFKEDGDTKMPEGCYFEVHLNIECTNEKLNKLNQISKSTNCHLSKNVFKIIDCLFHVFNGNQCHFYTPFLYLLSLTSMCTKLLYLITPPNSPSTLLAYSATSLLL